MIENLESLHGALLRMNRSIQVEGAFGILKQDRHYRRIVRKGLDKVKLESYIIALGFNFYKLHNKKKKKPNLKIFKMSILCSFVRSFLRLKLIKLNIKVI